MRTRMQIGQNIYLRRSGIDMKYMALFLTLCWMGGAYAAPITFQWDIPADTAGIDGYRVSCGITGAALSVAEDFAGVDTVTGSVDLAEGEWYCTAQSYADDGNTSSYSATVGGFFVHVPPPVVAPGVSLGTPSAPRITQQSSI